MGKISRRRDTRLHVYVCVSVVGEEDREDFVGRLH